MAWTMFMASYNYTVYTGKPEAMVYTTGLFAVFMSLAMMLRSDFTAEHIGKLLDNIKLGK